jgi:hypothetical protein
MILRIHNITNLMLLLRKDVYAFMFYYLDSEK